MIVRVGDVIKVFPSEGKVQVSFADTSSSSLPLPLMTFGNEYSMPKVGDTVITLHMENGSSRGVCLGTYYGGGTEPAASSGYRKDFEPGKSFIKSNNGELTIDAKQIKLKCDYGTVSVEDLIKKLDDIEERLEALEEE